MTNSLANLEYSPDPAIADLRNWLGSEVDAADFPKTQIRFRNHQAAETVGLDTLSDDRWAKHFGRFAPLPGNLPRPLALKYHEPSLLWHWLDKAWPL